MPESVKIAFGALDELAGHDRSEIILRGVVDPESFHLLKVADYQREVLPISSINKLVKGFETGSIPDIDLGMRGGNYTEREGVYYLREDVYIIDGLQRVSAALHMLKCGSDKTPHLGAVVHFNTTEEWERMRFRVLNLDRTKLSPNVLLRNMCEEYEVVDTLHRLCHDKDFALAGRVCWSQRMMRNQLITARTMLKTVGYLHGHMGPGRSHKLNELGDRLGKIMERTGKNVFRDNARTFFDLVDSCWGIKRVAFKEGASYLKTTFLWVLAAVLSDHDRFWKGDRLFVEVDLVRKISSFPVTDPHVSNLAGSGGKAEEILYTLLVNHINSGKRTKRLVPRRKSGGMRYRTLSRPLLAEAAGQVSQAVE